MDITRWYYKTANVWWQGGLFGLLFMGLFVWSIVLISNINIKK